MGAEGYVRGVWIRMAVFEVDCRNLKRLLMLWP